jgi:hypothetical protein
MTNIIDCLWTCICILYGDCSKQWFYFELEISGIGWLLGLWCLMPLSTIFQLFHGGQCLLVEETGVPNENHRPVASHWQTFIT